MRVVGRETGESGSIPGVEVVVERGGVGSGPGGGGRQGRGDRGGETGEGRQGRGDRGGETGEGEGRGRGESGSIPGAGGAKEGRGEWFYS